jgi:hypothetical protein
MKVNILHSRTDQFMFWCVRPIRLSPHIVGIGVCLVVLTPFCARRARRCPLYRVRNSRYTKHIPATWYLYHLVGIYEGILDHESFKRLDVVFGEILRKQGGKWGFLGVSTTSWAILPWFLRLDWLVSCIRVVGRWVCTLDGVTGSVGWVVGR